jgi:hypothetical protein
MFLVKHERRTYCYSGCVTDGQGAITLIVKLRGHYFPFYGEKEIWKCGNSSTFLSIQVFSSISSALAFYDIFVDARLTSTKISARCCKSATFLVLQLNQHFFLELTIHFSNNEEEACLCMRRLRTILLV